MMQRTFGKVSVKKKKMVNKAICAAPLPRYLTSVYSSLNDRLRKRGQIYNIIRSFFISSLHPSHTRTHTPSQTPAWNLKQE